MEILHKGETKSDNDAFHFVKYFMRIFKGNRLNSFLYTNCSNILFNQFLTASAAVDDHLSCILISIVKINCYK